MKSLATISKSGLRPFSALASRYGVASREEVVGEVRFLEVRAEVAAQVRVPQLLQLQPAGSGAVDPAQRFPEVRVMRVSEQSVERTVGEAHPVEHRRRAAQGADLPPSSLGAREEAEHETDNIGRTFSPVPVVWATSSSSSSTSAVFGTFFRSDSPSGRIAPAAA